MDDRAAGVRAQIVEMDVAATWRGAWHDLAKKASTSNPFYAPDGVDAGMLLPEAGRPRLVLVWAGDRLIGVLPVATQRRRGVALWTENWDQRLRALGEPLVLSGHERDFWRGVLGLGRRLPGLWLRLSAVDAGSPATRALFDILRASGGPWYETRAYERAVLRRGLTSEQHAAQHIRGKVLKEHRRLRARLSDQGELRFERLGRDAEAGPWIDDLFRLEETGWKGREGVAASADAGTEACFRRMIEAAHAAGDLDFHRMTVGGQVIAMLANLERGDEAFQLKIAYDEAWASFSPGVLIEMAYLAYALDDRGLALVDSCARAGHPMIDRIWPERRRIVSLMIPHATPWSRLICRAQMAWRARRQPKLNRAVGESPS